MSDSIPEGFKVVQAHVFLRHGERTPVRKRLQSVIPPYWDVCRLAGLYRATVLSEKGKNQMQVQHLQQLPSEELEDAPKLIRACYDGQLSDIGKASTYNLGAYIRQLYVEKYQLLPEVIGKDDSNKFQFRSSHVPRAIESLQNLVSALLPTRPFVPDLIVRDISDESLIPDSGACKAQLAIKTAFVEAVDKATAGELAKLDPILEPFTKRKVRVLSSPSANGVLDTLAAAKAHHLPIPKELDSEKVIGPLHSAVVKEWFSAYQSERYTRLAIGPIFGELNQALEQKVKNNETPLKLGIWSAHDTTLGGILHGLHAFDGRWPPFTSHLRVELLEMTVPDAKNAGWFTSTQQKPSQHYVLTTYNGKKLKIPACEAAENHYKDDKTLCAFTAFSDALKRYAIGRREYRQDCAKKVDLALEMPIS